MSTSLARPTDYVMQRETVVARANERPRFWYEAIIDWLIDNPGGSYEACGVALGRSATYIGMLMKSEFLQARLAQRRAERRSAVDQMIIEKASGVVSKGLDILTERFSENTDRLSTALVADTTRNLLSVMGYSPTRVGEPPPPQQVTQVFVQVPGDLLAAARAKARTIEHEPSPPAVLASPNGT
jgi:hypothetical protein